MSEPFAGSLKHIVITVADWIADPAGLFVADFDLMARIPFHNEERAHLMQEFGDHLASQEARYRGEARILLNGETRWVQISGFASRKGSVRARFLPSPT